VTALIINPGSWLAPGFDVVKTLRPCRRHEEASA